MSRKLNIFSKLNDFLENHFDDSLDSDQLKLMDEEDNDSNPKSNKETSLESNSSKLSPLAGSSSFTSIESPTKKKGSGSVTTKVRRSGRNRANKTPEPEPLPEPVKKMGSLMSKSSSSNDSPTFDQSVNKSGKSCGRGRPPKSRATKRKAETSDTVVKEPEPVISMEIEPVTPKSKEPKELEIEELSPLAPAIPIVRGRGRGRGRGRSRGRGGKSNKPVEQVPLPELEPVSNAPTPEVVAAVPVSVAPAAVAKSPTVIAKTSEAVAMTSTPVVPVSTPLDDVIVLDDYYYSPDPGPTKPSKRAKKNTTTARAYDRPISIDSDTSTPKPPQHILATVDLTGGLTPPRGTMMPIFQPKPQLVEESSDSDLDDSYDIDKIRVKIKFKDNIKVHNMRKHQKFADVMAKIAQQENCSFEQVMLERSGKMIYTEDTPDSISYRISQLIVARVLNKSSLVTSCTKGNVPKNAISIKFMADKWKKPVTLKVSKYEKFQIIVEKLAEEIHHDHQKIKISFDGDPLSLKTSPDDEGFEGGEQIDLKLL